MKHSFRHLFTIAAVAVLSMGMLIPTAGAAQTAAPAQENGARPSHRRGQRMNPEHELSFLTRRLNLSQDQQNKIKPVLENEHKQMMDLRNDTSLTREQKRDKFMEIHKNTMDQIKSNLNAEQASKFEQLQQQRRQRMKAWREQHQAGNQATPPQNQQ